jgi:MFS family permease
VAPLDMNIGVSAYLLTLGVFIPISGWAAERFGPRRVFAAALALFTLASVLCGLAQGLTEFALLRVLQGIGGAMMVPVGRLVVLNNTPRHKLADAIATLTWPALVAPVLGPPVGGFIASYASWRWIFYLNLPVGLAAIAMAWRIVPSGGAGKPRPFDLAGFLLVGGTLWSLTWAAELLTRPDGGAARAAPFFAAGVVLGVLAIWHLRHARAPLFDLDALRTTTFAVTILGGSLARMAIGAVPFLLPLMFQVGFGLDAFHSGLLVLAVFAGNLVMKIRTTQVLRAFGFRRVLLVNGQLASILACALLSPGTRLPVISPVLFSGGMSRAARPRPVGRPVFLRVLLCAKCSSQLPHRAVWKENPHHLPRIAPDSANRVRKTAGRDALFVVEDLIVFHKAMKILAVEDSPQQGSVR